MSLDICKLSITLQQRIWQIVGDLCKCIKNWPNYELIVFHRITAAQVLRNLKSFAYLSIVESA